MEIKLNNNLSINFLYHYQIVIQNNQFDIQSWIEDLILRDLKSGTEREYKLNKIF